MLLAPLRWLAQNFSTLLLALILAIVVWVSAVVSADPNEENQFRPIQIEVIGQDSNLVLTGNAPTQAVLTITAPKSIWAQLNSNPNLAKAWIDLSGLEPGQHTVPVKARVDQLRPIRVDKIEPSEVTITLEPLVTKTFQVQLTVEGDTPLGYRKDTASVSPTEVTVSGPKSFMEKVAQVRATLNISGATELVKSTVPAIAVDENGDTVPNVNVTPKNVTATQPVTLLFGYKNVVVKPVTAGQIASGYRLTSISVTPLTVTVYSANPQLVNSLPGYVETKQIDVNGLKDNTDIRVELNLPPGVNLVAEQSVLVQIDIAAIESSLTVSLPVEALGLPPDLGARISPPSVDVIVSGPLPILDTLTPASFRAVVDLTGLEAGTYQLTPVVDLVPDQVQVQTILPETVEVTIATAATSMPTIPFAGTPGPNFPSIPSKTPQP